jgi:hypothetical protein
MEEKGKVFFPPWFVVAPLQCFADCGVLHGVNTERAGGGSFFQHYLWSMRCVWIQLAPDGGCMAYGSATEVGFGGGGIGDDHEELRSR